MKKKPTITVQGTAISIRNQPEGEYISLTDIARHRNAEHSDDLVRNWLRNRNTVEFLGVWEQIHNPGFNPVEFDGIRKQSGLNSFTYASEADVLNMALFGQTAKQWRDTHPEADGNIRDHAAIEQLLVLANIEGMNAEFIRMSLPQPQRLTRLNQIAISQLRALAKRGTPKSLPGGREELEP